MPRILGVEIRTDKPTWVALTDLYGIGPYRAREVLARTGIPAQRRAAELTPAEIRHLEFTIRTSYEVEGELKRRIRDDIKHEKDLSTYRGLRHRRGLPVRGQRTRTNAKTRKYPGWGRKSK